MYRTLAAAHTALTNAAADKIWWAVLAVSTASMYPDVSKCDNTNATKRSLAASLPVHTIYAGTQARKRLEQWKSF